MKNTQKKKYQLLQLRDKNIYYERKIIKRTKKDEIRKQILEKRSNLSLEEVDKKSELIIENLTPYLKNAQKYDGIITSGPIGYEIIKNSVELFTPLYHFDISKGDLYKYLFNILKKNPKIDFSRFYIDFISPEKKEYWFQDVFKKEEEPIFYQINFSNKNLHETLKSNYINLKKENKIDMVLTRISNMVKFLKNEDIKL